MAAAFGSTVRQQTSRPGLDVMTQADAQNVFNIAYAVKAANATGFWSDLESVDRGRANCPGRHSTTRKRESPDFRRC